MLHSKNKAKGLATVERIDGGIIYCKLQGAITEPIARSAMAQTKALVLAAKREGSSALLLLDVSDVTSQDSGSRSAAKEISEFQLDKIAVFGGNRLLRMLGQYILRSGGMSEYGKVFASRHQATEWLEQKGTHAKRDRRIIAFWALTGMSVLISASGLIGWIVGKPIFFTISDSHRAVNPVGAAVIIALACAVPYLLMKKPSVWYRISFLLVTLWSIFFGIAVVLRYLTGIDANADTWLFTNQLETGSYSARLSLLGGVMFAALGSMSLLVALRKLTRWPTVLLYAVSLISLIVPILVIIGYSFAIESLYTANGSRAITLPTTIATACVAIAILCLNATKRAPSTARKMLNNYWQGGLVFFAIIILTGFAWQQTRNDITKDRDQLLTQTFDSTTDTISNRITAYIDALRGYQSYFAASTIVSPSEFSTYYKTFDIQNRYPGMTGLTFVREIPRNQLSAYAATVRKEFASYGADYATYQPFPANAQSATAYPLLLIQPDSGRRSLGFDLSSDAERRHTLSKARDTGEITATGLINLNQSRPGTPRSNGFFLSVPIFTKNPQQLKTVTERRAAIIGMVNAVVNDNRLFSDVFKHTDTSNLQYAVSTGDNPITTVYETPKPTHQLTKTQKRTLDIAGQRWFITVRASDTFGISTTRKFTSYLVLAGGFMLAAMAAAQLVSQTRRREQALTLASKMTEDLQQERDSAVTLQQKDEAVLSSIGDAVFAINTDGVVTLFNQAAERISGYTAREVIGKSYEDILIFQNETTNKPQTAFIMGALRGKVTSMKSNTILIRKDGSRVQVADSAAPIRNTRGDLQGVIVVFRDISKEYELDKAKTEFVSLASHQLRTPLSAINWYAEMLTNGDAGKLPKEAQSYVTEIYEGNQRMVELVNSLLDVSRLELGKLANNPQPTDMVMLAESLEKELTTSIVSKQLSFSKKIAKKLPVVEGDPKFLRMILQNLLSNAVKYTPAKGAVGLTMRTATSEEVAHAKLHISQSALYIAVSDTGYGIPLTQQSKIFSKLFRADNVRALDVEGTGLGLYIVKEVVEKMGGKVWFTSKESLGTTFYVILPYKTKTVHVAPSK